MVEPSSEHSEGKPVDFPTTTAAAESPTAAATLYVDTENLRDSAQTLIESAIESWPEQAPPVARLNLYVRADLVQLWDLWAASRFPDLTVMVHGIQHFSGQPTKNSADIALAIDAVADFMAGATQFAAVMSDDSDFIALYAKLRQLAEGSTPFLWVLTDRPGTRSTTIRDYFPSAHIHVVSAPLTDRAEPAPSTAPVPDNDVEDPTEPFAAMAAAIIRELPVEPFKSTDCQPIIKKHWSDHPMATMPGPKFGTEFANDIWPLLKERGVKLVGTGPRRYEMTAAAKATKEKHPARLSSSALHGGEGAGG